MESSAALKNGSSPSILTASTKRYITQIGIYIKCIEFRSRLINICHAEKLLKELKLLLLEKEEIIL